MTFIVVGTTIGINAVLTRTRRARPLPDDEGLRGRPVHPADQPQAPLRLPLAQARRRSCDRPDCLGVAERARRGGRRARRRSTSRRSATASQRGSRQRRGRPSRSRSASSSPTSTPSTSWPPASCSRERFPELPVSLSHEIAPIWREYERGTTTIVDAYLEAALRALRRRRLDGARRAGRRRALGAAEVERRPRARRRGARAARRTSCSRASPAARSAARYFARAAGAPEAIALDMGGTSCDVCLIVDGEPLYSSDFEIEFGLPVSVPSVSTRTIGAGGGSIGWVDPGGFLQVGPQSAGADPGPGLLRPRRRGGDDHRRQRRARPARPRLLPRRPAAARRPSSRARRSTRLGERLGLRRVERRLGRWSASRTRTWRTRSASSRSRRASTRASFALIAFGGAGPTHACEIADAIGMRRVVVPPRPGLCSAFGALAASVRVDAVRSVYLTDRHDLGRRARRRSSASSRRRRTPTSPRRAPAQEPEVRRVDRDALPGPELRAGGRRAATARSTTPRSTRSYADYGRLYEEFYGYRLDGIPIELVRLSVVATGRAAGVRRACRPRPPRARAPATRRRATSPGRLRGRRAIVRRAAPRRRASARGPADRRVDGLDGRRPAELDARATRRATRHPATARRARWDRSRHARRSSTTTS